MSLKRRPEKPSKDQVEASPEESSKIECCSMVLSRRGDDGDVSEDDIREQAGGNYQEL